MNREEMEDRATELGISFRANIGDEKLMARIAEAEGASQSVERIAAKVLWANVWSSEGKHMKNDVFEFLAEDFALLDSKDAIKKV